MRSSLAISRRSKYLIAAKSIVWQLPIDKPSCKRATSENARRSLFVLFITLMPPKLFMLASLVSTYEENVEIGGKESEIASSGIISSVKRTYSFFAYKKNTDSQNSVSQKLANSTTHSITQLRRHLSYN
jgi:hypothetical protein